MQRNQKQFQDQMKDNIYITQEQLCKFTEKNFYTNASKPNAVTILK